MAKNVRANKTSAARARDLDVEIRFLEGLAARDAHWIDALKLLGDSYTRRGRVQDGLRIDEELARLCPDDALVFYNLACSLALAERFSDAFDALHRAFALGYHDFKWLAKDPDLAKLRRQPAYKEFLARFGVAK
ncbi:MAG: hypothetical protein HZA90_10090 [Verrucomicrobia bacterium]|nr:hypothetical protein [Verrucomicrobiota bacterium]